MLRKLLKYEFKATGRIFLPLFLALVVFASITKLFSGISPNQFPTPARITMFIYVIIMISMFVMTFIMMIQRFHKNLLSDEGYLMFTLPVKPWKHIASKLLTSMLWVIASGITAFVSIFIIGFQKGKLTNIMSNFSSFHQDVINQLGPSVYILAFELIIASLLMLASAILIVYTAIAIGQLFNKHKILASFASFIALTIFEQISNTLISLIPGVMYFSNMPNLTPDLLGAQSFMMLAILYRIILTTFFCIVYFAASNYILSKHLNLE